jgi:hypothetical protein
MRSGGDPAIPARIDRICLTVRTCSSDNKNRAKRRAATFRAFSSKRQGAHAAFFSICLQLQRSKMRHEEGATKAVSALGWMLKRQGDG